MEGDNRLAVKPKIRPLTEKDLVELRDAMNTDNLTVAIANVQNIINKWLLGESNESSGHWHWHSR